ncbi:hypothetical protein B0H11DRAFT_2090279 [Mycena galericulata]|nr:hypothetical protein B0H11DRAFT_2090279 [Mycena galericulata]
MADGLMFLFFIQIFANNLLNAHAKASGMPEPRPIAIVAGEFETPEHIIAVRQIHCECLGRSPIALQIARDPGMARLASAEEFSPERGACVFSAQIGTYIDKPGSKDRAHGIAIHNVPQSMSAEEYKQKSATLLDRCLALPAAQKCLLKCTVWSKYDSDSLERQIQSVGLPVPESDTFVIRFEYENQDRLMELVSDSGTHTIIEAAMKDLNFSQGSYFCADVSTVFERN